MKNRIALARAQRVLDEIPEHRLHMRNWAEMDDHCGTAFCFAGWLALDPWFRRHGIRLVRSMNKKKAVTNEKDAAKVMGKGGLLCVVTTDDDHARSMRGFAELFGASIGDVSNLFADGQVDFWGPHAVTKKMVAENLQRICDGKSTVPYAQMKGFKRTR